MSSSKKVRVFINQHDDVRANTYKRLIDIAGPGQFSVTAPAGLDADYCEYLVDLGGKEKPERLD